ncbi:MAG: cytochrome c oxidase assembly protein [Gemmatimonadaceae bacterium]
MVTGGLALTLLPRLAVAHETRSIAPTQLWSAWTFEPLVVVSLALVAILYARGVRRLWSASHRGAGLRVWEVGSFAAGWTAIALALTSPLHALGSALFSAHMTQHELLISVGAPLIVLGKPLIAFVWSLESKSRQTAATVTKVRMVSATWNGLSRPSVAFGLHAIALWVWHLPGPYQATLHSDVMHSLQHASFLFSALLFWWAILSARGAEFGRGAAVFYLFATALQTGALGALLTFSQTLWYPAYSSTTTAWGLTPLEDQQLGGLIMWIPGSIAYLVAALTIFAGWLRESDRRTMRRETVVLGLRVAVICISLATLAACDRASGDERHMLTNADVDRGEIAIRKYGCGSCHTIDGITGARGLVGPPLTGIASRVYIAGVLPNVPGNMISWLENPPGVDPKTAMPNMGVTPRDARDIAAYLYTLR